MGEKNSQKEYGYNRITARIEGEVLEKLGSIQESLDMNKSEALRHLIRSYDVEEINIECNKEKKEIKVIVPKSLEPEDGETLTVSAKIPNSHE